MLESLTVENFRGFEKLELTGLRRVNLIVGKNNTGKTTLLEALTLVTNPPMLTGMPGLFRANAGAVDVTFFPWLARDGGGGGFNITANGSVGDRKIVAVPEGQATNSQLRWADKRAGLDFNATQGQMKVHAASVQQRSLEGIVFAFAELMRAPADEKRLTDLLRAVDPRVKDVRIDLASEKGEKNFIAVDVGLSKRIPLSQVGQGLYRLVAIFAELMGKKPEICFLDEIENGIHYRALPVIWKGIAEVAEQLNLQVFATTHSRECLEAAHEVFEERVAQGKPYELGVIQLYRTDAGVTGRVLQEKHLDAAVTSDIELR